MSDSPLVAIIIVSWNRRADTLACVRSLEQQSYPRTRIIVVDNASRDGSAAAVRSAHPQVEVVESGDNLGAAGGLNLGWRHAAAAGAEYAWLLNNDTQFAPDTLTHLVRAAAASPRIGIVGPTVYSLDAPDLIVSAGCVIDWARGRCRNLTGDDAPAVGAAAGAPSRRVDYVAGCAMLAKRAVFENVGGLDSRFFVYYEEIEWCVRAGRAGYETHYVPQARVWHRTPPRGATPPLHVYYYMTRNRLLFLSITGASARAWLHTLFAEYLRTVASWSLRPKWRGMRRHRNLTLQAVRDYFTGRLGRASWLDDQFGLKIED